MAVFEAFENLRDAVAEFKRAFVEAWHDYWHMQWIAYAPFSMVENDRMWFRGHEPLTGAIHDRIWIDDALVMTVTAENTSGATMDVELIYESPPCQMFADGSEPIAPRSTEEIAAIEEANRIAAQTCYRQTERRKGSYCLEGTSRDRRRQQRRTIVSSFEREMLMGGGDAN